MTKKYKELYYDKHIKPLRNKDIEMVARADLVTAKIEFKNNEEKYIDLGYILIDWADLLGVRKQLLEAYNRCCTPEDPCFHEDCIHCKSFWEKAEGT